MPQGIEKKFFFMSCLARLLLLPQIKITTLISFLQKKAYPVPPGSAFFVLYRQLSPSFPRFFWLTTHGNFIAKSRHPALPRL